MPLDILKLFVKPNTLFVVNYDRIIYDHFLQKVPSAHRYKNSKYQYLLYRQIQNHTYDVHIASMHQGWTNTVTNSLKPASLNLRIQGAYAYNI